MPAERLYLHDGALLAFTATVTDIRELRRSEETQIWQIALDRTAFYPAGGGQPCDRGVLRARARSGAELDVAIDEVEEDELGEVWHTATKPLLAGTVVEGLVDGERRADHRQQHSGQHVLSAILADHYGALTVGFHLGASDSTIDLAVEDKAAQAELLAKLPTVEEDVNRRIQRGLAVSLRTVSQEEAQKLLAAGALRKLPQRSGPIRLVEMPGLDLNACGGTHVGDLSEIGPVLLRSTERVRKQLRVHFLCGLRAVRAARADFAELAAASAALSAAPGQLTTALEQLQAENKGLARERSMLRERLATLHAVQLAVEERPENGVRVVYRRFADSDRGYLQLLADRLLAAVPRTIALLESTLGEPATLLLASNFEPGSACNTILEHALSPWELRSGGTALRAQAEVPLRLLDVVTDDLLRQVSVLQ